MFERTKNLKVSIIKQMELEAAKYADVVSLAQGIPSFDTPDVIKKRVKRSLDSGAVARYSLTLGIPELREQIEAHLARENMFYDWQSEIIVTAGSIEAITASIMAITNPDDEIIIPEPTYTSYREVITLAGCETVFVPLDESRGWAFDLEKYEKAITDKTKAIFYCNPNNPTGTIYSREQLLGLAKLAEKYDLFLISDEVYKDFIYDEAKKNIFSLAEIPELRKRVIRIFSFSKAYAMTGWRAGYVHSDAENIAQILKVHDSLVTCAPVISQFAALGALEAGEEAVKEFNAEYLARRELICKHLDNMGDIFEYVYPESAYFVFPKIKKGEFKHDSWNFCLDLLKNAKVALVPGFAFGPNGEGHVRMSFGRTKEDIDKAFERMKKNFE